MCDCVPAREVRMYVFKLSLREPQRKEQFTNYETNDDDDDDDDDCYCSADSCCLLHLTTVLFTVHRLKYLIM